MRFSFNLDDFGRLECHLLDGGTETTAYSSEVAKGLSDLGEAVDALESEGYGECFWEVSAGEFRWLLKREGERVRCAVLWCGSVAVGFQHVFWAEDDLKATIAQLREAMAQAKLADPA